MGFWPEFEGSRRTSLLDGTWDYGLHLPTGGSCSFISDQVIGTGKFSRSAAASKEECCSKCTSDGRCKAFTYEPEEQLCYLKDNTEPGEARTGAASGLRVGVDIIDSMDAALNPSDPKLTRNSTSVPMTIDAVNPGYMGPRGAAFYRRNFTQHKGPARLQFGACGFYCRVWVDGQEIGDHRAGGYVGFHLDVPAVAQDTERELVVLADNRFNSTTAPLHTGGDFWHYGGLMRSVVLHDLPDGSTPWPWRAHVLPTEGYKDGEVNMTLTTTDPSFSGKLPVSVAFDSGKAAEMTVDVKDGVARLDGLRVPEPKLWTTKDPQLHTVTVTVDGAGVTERFGLRWWGVDPESSRLTLNGEVLKLHGWNHHTQWPDTGASPTDAQLDTDLKQMLAAGTNYIRGAHYPQDQRWLDRLDEAGVVMWEETLGPGVSVGNILDPDWMKLQLQQLDEMLDMSMNHASIMTWGWFNEGPSNREGACPGYQACSERAQQRDPTRFRTWADNHELDSKCLEYASLVSFNNYPAWYNNPGDLSEPAKHWNSMADTVRAQYPGKPFVISETGAGGVYEWDHNTTDAKWTQKYQTEVISRDVDVALSNDNISGVTLWHYFDFKGNDDATLECGPCEYIPDSNPPTCSYVDVNCNRPAGLNHKGVVDFWRREKQAYSVVAEKYNKALTTQGAELTV